MVFDRYSDSIPPVAIEERRHSNGPRSARSRYTTVRHSAPRGDFRPATGSETHVFGRVCSHNTICLPSSPLLIRPSRSFPPSRALSLSLSTLALQCVPYSTAGKKKSERHRVCVIRAYRIVSFRSFLSIVRSLIRLFRSPKRA